MIVPRPRLDYESCALIGRPSRGLYARIILANERAQPKTSCLKRVNVDYETNLISAGSYLNICLINGKGDAGQVGKRGPRALQSVTVASASLAAPVFACP